MAPPPPPPAADDASLFPNVQAKLQKPARQSAFEKQKAEAEAKRQREAAETAAVYQDFVKSFQDAPETSNKPRSYVQPRPRVPPGPGPRRHLGPAGATPVSVSVPVSTSALKTSAPAQTALNRPHRPISAVFGDGSDDDEYDSNNSARPRNDALSRDRRRGGGGGGGMSRNSMRSLPGPASFELQTYMGTGGSAARDSAPLARSQDKAVSKPTLRLANLPPGTSVARIRSLVAPLLAVDDIKILPPPPQPTLERRSAVAVVTLSQDTPATDIDSAVSSLQNIYIGYGYYLSLHRHLSSAVSSVASTAALASGTSSSSAPFGAKPAAQKDGQQAYSQHNRRFAPPPSYGRQYGPSAAHGSLMHVPVLPPSDINQVRLIHHVVERLLEHGPELEALLMSRPEVQRDEKWAWLWDARSQGGIWYRWRLWEIVSGFDDSTSRRAKYLPLFEGSHAWKVPDRRLPFQHVTSVDEFCSDQDYDSADDMETDDEGPTRDADRVGDNESETAFLNPLRRARLAHLLSRLPTNISRLRKGDVARITTFAIRNVSRGADEIVDMVVWNVEKPFPLSLGLGAARGGALEDAATGQADKVAPGGDDFGAACLVGMYVISDILSSSSTSGVRHAWRYRQLFEAALSRRKVFETLGTMPEKLSWGRLRMEKWKRSIGLVLSLWEGWCVFPTESHESFAESFENPPKIRTETSAAGDEDPRRSKWKVVEAVGTVAALGGEMEVGGSDSSEQLDGVAFTDQKTKGCRGEKEKVEEDDDDEDDRMAADDEGAETSDERDVSAEAMSSDEEVDGVPMSDDDLGGEAVDKDAPPPSLRGEDNKAISVEPRPAAGTGASADEGRRPRKRMRAVDMFADSDVSE